MFKQKRHERNVADMHNSDADYPFNRFGTGRSNIIYNLNFMPAKDNAIILGWNYSDDSLTTLFKMIGGQKMCKKDFADNQIVFEPNILVYMIFLSEDDKLKEYLRCWKKYKYRTDMKIDESNISEKLRPYCTCSGCFGKCVRIIMKYNVLPDVINHEMMRDFMDSE